MGSGVGDIAGGVGNTAGGLAGYFASSAGQKPTVDLGQVEGQETTNYNTATNDATQTMNAAQSANSNNQAILNSTNGNTTSAMGNLNAEANENLSNYGSTFTNLQQEQANQAANYAGPENVRQLQGQAVANQTQATQAALANQRASLASEGVDPASAHGSALTQQAQIQGAASAAGAASNAYTQAQLTGAQLENNANQIGLNVGAQGAQQSVESGQLGLGQAQTNAQVGASGISNLTAANQYLGTANTANSTLANTQEGQFGEQQQLYQDQQQQAASKAAAIGQTVAGMGQTGAGVAESVASAARGGAIPNNARIATAHNIQGVQPTSYLQGGVVTPRGALPHPIVPGTTDTKLAALTPGEFVIPRDVAQHMGHEKLHKLIDKTREDIGARAGAIPGGPQQTSAHFSR